MSYNFQGTGRDIKTKTQLEDFMITITILFFDNNKNKDLILVQMQVTVMYHNERRTVRRRVERDGEGETGGNGSAAHFKAVGVID